MSLVFWKITAIAITLLIGGIGIFQNTKRKDSERPTWWAYGLLFLMILSSLASFLVQTIESNQAQQKSDSLQHNLAMIIDGASRASRTLSELHIQGESLLEQSTRPMYPLEQFRISLNIAYVFAMEDTIADAFFARTQEPALRITDENSTNFPNTNPKEIALRQLLHNSFLRIEFTLPGRTAPSLVYSTNRNFQPYSYFCFRENRVIAFDAYFDASKIWVDSGSVVSAQDLIGATMVVKLDILAPHTSKIQSMGFALNGMQEIGRQIANNKHLLKASDFASRIIQGDEKHSRAVAFYHLITASDIGLSESLKKKARDD